MNSMDDYDFRAPGLVFTQQNVCTTFCIRNGVKRAFKRRNILNVKEMTLNFRHNRRMIAICESLGMF